MYTTRSNTAGKVRDSRKREQHMESSGGTKEKVLLPYGDH